MISSESVTVQRCALPLPVAPSLSVSVREHRDGLEAVGFGFGEHDGQLSLTAYPSLPGGMAEDPLRLLRSVLLEFVTDESLQAGEGPAVFVNATHVKSAKGRIFRRETLTVDAILASACLPINATAPPNCWRRLPRRPIASSASQLTFPNSKTSCCSSPACRCRSP